MDSKLTILYIMDALIKKSDEAHPLTLKDLEKELSRHNLSLERKTLYKEIERLQEFGLDIIKETSQENRYYIGKREFELPELKILVDAVQSSRFLTEKKSKELIKKLETLTSIHQGRELQRQVFVSGRIKSMNETIYYGIDNLHMGISEGLPVSFQYTSYNLTKKQTPRRNGETYLVSPYALSWTDENYYLIAYHKRYERICHFRVDRMKNIQVEPEKRESFVPKPQGFNVAKYVNEFFGMFGGTVESVCLQFHNELLNVVLDRFGSKALISKNCETDNFFLLNAKVAISEPFVGWLFMFGDKVKVIHPETLVNRLKKISASVFALYSQ